jgi:hypothetical protein
MAPIGSSRHCSTFSGDLHEPSISASNNSFSNLALASDFCGFSACGAGSLVNDGSIWLVSDVELDEEGHPKSAGGVTSHLEIFPQSTPAKKALALIADIVGRWPGVFWSIPIINNLASWLTNDGNDCATSSLRIYLYSC